MQDEEHQAIIAALQVQVNALLQEAGETEEQRIRAEQEIAALKATLKETAGKATTLIAKERTEHNQLKRKFNETVKLLAQQKARVFRSFAGHRKMHTHRKRIHRVAAISSTKQ